MPTKRTKIDRSGKGRITEEVIGAWHRCDFGALHLALDLKPWQASPLPSSICCLGVDEEDAADHAGDLAQTQRALQWQRRLFAVAGWPANTRKAYEKNLQEAFDWRDYTKQQLVHCTHQGTGSDLASRQAAVEEAERKVAYRRWLLDSLDGP